MEPIRSDQWPSRRLRRPTEGRVLAGVAAGVADYLDVDVVVVRIVLVALALAGGAGIPLYLAAWLLTPDDAHDEPLAVGLVSRGVAMASRPAAGAWPESPAPATPGPAAEDRSGDGGAHADDGADDRSDRAPAA